MPICGLNLNISSIQGDITAKISGFINLDDVLTTPDKLSEYKSTFESGMASLKAKADSLVPDIPISSSGFTSLRDELASYVSTPSIGGLADISSKFGGLTSLTGFADINLSDLASSALSLSASFDPCALAGDLKIPNVVADASGQLDALTDQVPDIGATVMSLKRQIPDSKMFDSLALGMKDNIKVLTTSSVATAKDLFESNIIPSAEAAIRKLPSGKEVIETVARHTETLAMEAQALQDEDSFASFLGLYDASKDPTLQAQQAELAKINGQRAATAKKLSSITMNEVQMYRMTDDGTFDDPSSPNYHRVNGVKKKLVMQGPSDDQYPVWVDAERASPFSRIFG
jgi:hypothetical protein